MINVIDEKYEEILETIWNLSEKKEYSSKLIKNSCSVDFSEEDVTELEKMGFIVRGGDKILFTSKGKTHAEKIVRRHRLTKVLLNSILRIKNAEMREIACKVEHTLLPEVEEAICTLLGHPEMCPDGSPIPPGRCCGNRTRTVANIVTSLNELEPGERGIVTFIRPSDHSQLHQLLSFGLNPGVTLSVHQSSPAFCIEFENTQLALDSQIARNIFVLRTPS